MPRAVLVRRALAAAIPVLLVVAGCSAPDGASSTGGPVRVRGSLATDTDDQKTSHAEDEVARRRGATPAEIFAAGAPQSFGVRPDGSLIAAWVVSADTGGEGPVQQAWRVLDARGHLLAQGRMGQTGEVLAVEDGFLVTDGAADVTARVRHVDLDGTTSVVTTSRRRAYPRRGDTLLPNLATFYRPSRGALLVSPVAPGVRQAGVAGGANAALSDTGVLYQYADPPRSPLPLAVTDDGGRRWRHTEVAVGGSRPSLVAAHGDTAVIARSRRASGYLLAGLSVTEDGGRTWRSTARPPGLRADGYVDQLSLGADGRALLGGYGTGWWRARSAASVSYARLPVPRDGVSQVRASRSRLFAMSGTAIWSSTDDGRYWTRLDLR